MQLLLHLSYNYYLKKLAKNNDEKNKTYSYSSKIQLSNIILVAKGNDKLHNNIIAKNKFNLNFDLQAKLINSIKY